MKQPLIIVRGTTKTMTVRVTNEDGSIYILQNNEILRFGVKKQPGDSAYLFSKEMSSDSYSDGVYQFIINPADTENLDFGCYYYDVGLQSGSEYYNVIECSEFRVGYNITQREVT